MTAKSLKHWCNSILPPDFKQLSAQTSKIQEFLVDNVSEPANQHLRVMNLTADEIIVAVSNPQIANYLRLHSPEIEQHIRESLHLNRKLKFRSMPDSIFEVGNNPRTNNTEPVLPETVDAIDRSADWIEDEGLKQAVQSLANTLKQK